MSVRQQVAHISCPVHVELPDHFEVYCSVSSVRLAYDSARRCQGFGQTQVQDSGSIFSKTAGVSLLDVLHQIPTLPEILTPDAQKALSATCKMCRLQLIARVQVVTTMRTEDYTMVFERRWPRLCMVILQDTHASSASQPSNLTRTINIYVSNQGGRQATISMCKPLHSLATDLPWTQLAVQQLAHQMRIRWPLDQFIMSHVHDLDGLGLEIVSQLVKSTWTQLVFLNLSRCELKAEAFLLLSQGNWPDLLILDVSCNCLDAEGIALLAKGNWPSLTKVTLSFDPTVDAVAIAHLSAAEWSVQELVIQDTLFSTELAADVAGLQLPYLSELYLPGAGFTAAAVSELARANWPSLRYLRIGHDDLDAVALLLGVDLEKVQELKSDTCLCPKVSEQRMASQAGVGLWPNLSWIEISKHEVYLTPW